MVVGILIFFLCGYFASIFMFSLAHNCFFFFIYYTLSFICLFVCFYLTYRLGFYFVDLFVLFVQVCGSALVATRRDEARVGP